MAEEERSGPSAPTSGAATDKAIKASAFTGTKPEATSSIPHLLSPRDTSASSTTASVVAEEDEVAADKSTTAPMASPAVKEEDALCHALGISTALHKDKTGGAGDDDGEEELTKVEYDLVPNPEADQCDLSVLRGTRAPVTKQEKMEVVNTEENDEDLEGLAELVPSLMGRTYSAAEKKDDEHVGAKPDVVDAAAAEKESGAQTGGDDSDDDSEAPAALKASGAQDDQKGGGDLRKSDRKWSVMANPRESITKHPATIDNLDSMKVQRSDDEEEKPKATGEKPGGIDPPVGDEHGSGNVAKKVDAPTSSSDSSMETRNNDDHRGLDDVEQNLGGFDHHENASSGKALSSDGSSEKRAGYDVAAVHESKRRSREARMPNGNAEDPNSFRLASSAASLSTATQTHEVRMPMYLPTFKPATGCTNASDFIVRCFVARLRSGITVVKHGRSRWCKSRLRILHVHSDGRSLSWKPAIGEPSSSKRPPKLDLSTCMEVRHAWSPDPLNPMFTGTPILRQKCEAANAHKSFALIFPKRTVDITAVTADQCKVLMEGFSALCFRLQVANLAGRGKKGGKDGEEEDRTSTASVTLTNNSTPVSPATGGGAPSARQKRSNHYR